MRMLCHVRTGSDSAERVAPARGFQRGVRDAPSSSFSQLAAFSQFAANSGACALTITNRLARHLGSVSARIGTCAAISSSRLRMNSAIAGLSAMTSGQTGVSLLQREMSSPSRRVTVETKELISLRNSAREPSTSMVSRSESVGIRNVLRVRKNARNRPDGRGNTASHGRHHAAGFAPASKLSWLDRG